jgi:hypothetical protein
VALFAADGSAAPRSQIGQPGAQAVLGFSVTSQGINGAPDTDGYTSDRSMSRCTALCGTAVKTGNVNWAYAAANEWFVVGSVTYADVVPCAPRLQRRRRCVPI